MSKKNKQILNLLKTKEENNQAFTKEDKDLLAAYNPTEGQDALYSFFTPVWVCEYMFKLAEYYGYKGGPILEPACGHGNVLSVLPQSETIHAFEINETNRKIAAIRNPAATIYQNYFETAFLQPPKFRSKLKGDSWLNDGKLYKLVIGNPPYGVHKNFYSPHFKPEIKRFKQIEIFFLFKGLQLLEKNGLLVYITSSSFLRTGNAYKQAKSYILHLADMIDAYRMPTIFEGSSVQTDILIFRKK